MARLIDADALIEKSLKDANCYMDNNDIKHGYHNVQCLIYDAPTIDAVPVVRCKDCKHCEYASNRIPTEQAWVCYKWGVDVKQDGFCAVGERRDDELQEDDGRSQLSCSK